MFSSDCVVFKSGDDEQMMSKLWFLIIALFHETDAQLITLLCRLVYLRSIFYLFLVLSLKKYVYIYVCLSVDCSYDFVTSRLKLTVGTVLLPVDLADRWYQSTKVDRWYGFVTS